MMNTNKSNQIKLHEHIKQTYNFVLKPNLKDEPRKKNYCLCVLHNVGDSNQMSQVRYQKEHQISVQFTLLPAKAKLQ